MNRKSRSSRTTRRIKAKFSQAKRNLSNSFYDLRYKLGDFASYAKHNPLKTLGVSAIAGVLIASIMRGRRH